MYRKTRQHTHSCTGSMPHPADLENLPLNDSEDSAALEKRAESGKDAGPASSPLRSATSLRSAASTGQDELPMAFELEHKLRSEPSAKWYHAAFHSITAMVGAGILALPYSFSYLTWSGGIISLVLCTTVSLYCSHLLAEFHEGPAPDRIRYNRYRDVGRAVLGYRVGTWTIVPIQTAVCIGLDIAYTLTAGQSLQAVQNPSCNTHTFAKTTAHEDQNCATALSWWIAGFALVQIALSQLRDFHSLWWVSLVGALMSALYSTIAFVASLVAVRDGVEYSMRPGSLADRTFGVFNAIGTVVFAFGGQAVQLEIQATLARPPSPYREMMKGIYAAYVLIVVAYFGVSIAGFAAFGNSINPDILLSISKPQWLIKAANLMVVVHVAASFQLFAHPMFEAMEGLLTSCIFRKLPDKEPPYLLRAVLRTVYCAVCGVVAVLLPFFNDVIGIVGSIGFMPMSFIFPPLFVLVAKRYRGPAEYWLCVTIMAVMGTAGLLAFVGSLRNLIVRAQAYHY